MLVLTRKLQEQIRIGDSITISILRVKGNTVRIGIQAPREVHVVRAELPALEDTTLTLPGPEAVIASASAKGNGDPISQTPELVESTRTCASPPRVPGLRRFRLAASQQKVGVCDVHETSALLSASGS